MGFDFHDGPYARNEAIYISGDWDIFDFPCAVGTVYLVPNDGTRWDQTRPITGFVSAKTVQGCYGAAAFYGAILDLPPLLLGQYDIVMDEEEDGVFDPGEDLVVGSGAGFALRVDDFTLDQQVDVAAIKASAAAQADHWFRLGIATTVAFKAFDVLGSAIESRRSRWDRGATA